MISFSPGNTVAATISAELSRLRSQVRHCAARIAIGASASA